MQTRLVAFCAVLMFCFGLSFGQMIIRSSDNSELMRVTEAGRVGIGTSSPGARVEIDSRAGNNSGLRFTQLTAASPPSPINNLALSIDAAGNVILVPNPPALGDNLGNHVANQNLQMSGFWVSNDGGTEGLWVDAVGNVGVNVQGPATDLHIFNNSGTAIPELLIQQVGPGIAALNYAIPPQSVTSGIDPGDLNCYKITGIPGFAANTYKDPLTLTRIQTAQNLFGITDINHQSRADGWLSFMQLVPPVWTQIMFDQTLYDEHLEFNTAAPSSFTALLEGYYQVEARTEFNLLETEQPQWRPNCFVEIAIRVNNQPFANGNRLAVTDANAVPLFYNNAPVVTRVVHLLPGQSVSIWVLHNLVAPVLLMPGAVETYVSVHKIS